MATKIYVTLTQALELDPHNQMNFSLIASETILVPLNKETKP